MAGTSTMPGKRIALLIDAENVGASHYVSIITNARRLGDPIVSRVFGDFSHGRIAEWASIPRLEGLETICQITGGKGKNSADIAMTIHAMDILHEKRVDAFCLVSSDCDFLPLAIRLKSSGLKVYGMGNDRSDQALKNACTDFFVLKQAPPPPKSIPAVAAAKQKPVPPPALRLVAKSGDTNSIAALIRQIIVRDGADGAMPLSRLATAMRANAPELVSEFCKKGKFRNNLKGVDIVFEVNNGTSVQLRG